MREPRVAHEGKLPSDLMERDGNKRDGMYATDGDGRCGHSIAEEGSRGTFSDIVPLSCILKLSKLRSFLSIAIGLAR